MEFINEAIDTRQLPLLETSKNVTAVEESRRSAIHLWDREYDSRSSKIKKLKNGSFALPWKTVT